MFLKQDECDWHVPAAWKTILFFKLGCTRCGRHVKIRRWRVVDRANLFATAASLCRDWNSCLQKGQTTPGQVEVEEISLPSNWTSV